MVCLFVLDPQVDDKIKQQLSAVKNILAESTKILCDNLDLEQMLPELKSKGALSFDDCESIKKADTKSEMVDKFIEILRRKPTSAYDNFMETIQQERPDLYNAVNKIGKKHNYEHSSGRSTRIRI